MPESPPLKFGKKPPQNKPALRLRSFLSGTLPEHPLEAHHLNIGGWQMLGNDRWGDCVAVTWADIRRIMTRLAGTEHYPTLDEVLAVYKTQNPGFPSQDDGMYIQELLGYLHKNAGPDGAKPIAFARVDQLDPEEVAAAIAIFGCLWVGFNVQEMHMSYDWPRGLPFDYHPGDEWIGGHSVIIGGYDSDRVGPGKEMKTWAKVTAFTDEGWANCVDEAWVVVWPENLGTSQFQVGIDRTALANAYQVLTGRELPLPPEPTPGVDAADQALAWPLKDWAYSRNVWSRFTKAGKAAAASREWLTRKGL